MGCGIELGERMMIYPCFIRYIPMYVCVCVCTHGLSCLFVCQLSCISECVPFFLQRDHSEA